MANCTNIQDSILEVFNIGKRYKNRSVLRNVSLNVRRGEAVGLLGPNGAGKTTCFYCVTGLITPDYGDVHIDGQDITYMPMYKRARLGIGYLPQEASIFRNLSVEDNIKAVLEIVVDDKEKQFFTKEQISQKARQMGVEMKDYNEEELGVTTAMVYTDYCKTAKKYIGNNMDFFIELARDWLEDKDTEVKGGEKLAIYYDCIVEGED